MAFIGDLTDKDVVAQMARCSFDSHIDEILGTLIIGASVVMLRPEGIMDYEYLATVLTKKQITRMGSVPSFFHNFFIFLRSSDRMVALKSLRSLGSGGKCFLEQIMQSHEIYVTFIFR